MSDLESVLGRCIGDVSRFAAENWGRSPLICRSRDSFDDLLSSEAIIDLLELSARRPMMRMVRDGATIAPAEYTKSVRMGGISTSDVADVDRVAGQLAAGATLVLQNLERVHPPIRAFAFALQTEISHPVQANAYLSPPGAAGLGRHADTHDVIVIQLDGAKSWDIEGLGLIEIAGGDVVYIPRGCPHAASTAARHSLHLTVGISAITLGDVVRRALNSADIDLHQPLPLGFASHTNDHSLAETIASSFESVARDLTSRDCGEVVRSERVRVEETLRKSHRLRAQLEAIAITDATKLRRRTDVSLVVTTNRAVLQTADRELRMPVSAAGALQTLVDNAAMTVGQLAGLNEASRLVLARRLLREGVVELNVCD